LSDLDCSLHFRSQHVEMSRNAPKQLTLFLVGGFVADTRQSAASERSLFRCSCMSFIKRAPFLSIPFTDVANQRGCGLKGLVAGGNCDRARSTRRRLG